MAQPAEPAAEEAALEHLGGVGSLHTSPDYQEPVGRDHQRPPGPLRQLHQELLELNSAPQAG